MYIVGLQLPTPQFYHNFTWIINTEMLTSKYRKTKELELTLHCDPSV